MHNVLLLFATAVCVYLAYLVFGKLGEVEKEHINPYRKPSVSFVWVPVLIIIGFFFVAVGGVSLTLFLLKAGFY